MPPDGPEPTLAEKLAAAARKLEPVTDTPRLDAEILLAAALRISRAQLMARLKERADAPSFEEYLARRMNYEPLAYILGEWEFFSMPFEVQPPLLVPRPETEHLVEAVLDYATVAAATAKPGAPPPLRILELGTGTGCVAVAVAANAPAVSITATDLNPLALEVASRNARRHKVAARIEFRQGDLFQALKPTGGAFDAICSNPPYIEDAAWPELSPVIRLHEDPDALLAGPDGLDIIRRIVHETPNHLVKGGLLAFEIGMGQQKAVENLLKQGSYQNIRFRNDLAGIPRIACANLA